MPQMRATRFISFTFDNPDEERNAKIFNSFNVMHLCNLRTQIQEQKLSLKIDPDKPLHNLQNEASLTGQIELLDLILKDCEDALTEQNELQTSQQKG